MLNSVTNSVTYISTIQVAFSDINTLSISDTNTIALSIKLSLDHTITISITINIPWPYQTCWAASKCGTT
jgi:hypothetical protein